MTPPRDGLLQMIQQNDEKHSDAHKRLRQDLDTLERQVNEGLEILRRGKQENTARIDTLEKMPIDATKLMLRTPVVVAVVIFVVTLVAGVWSIRSSIDRMGDKIETVGKLQDVQNAALKTSVDEMRRRQELQQYEIQGLKEAINLMTGKGSSNERR